MDQEALIKYALWIAFFVIALAGIFYMFKQLGVV